MRLATLRSLAHKLNLGSITKSLPSVFQVTQRSSHKGLKQLTTNRHNAMEATRCNLPSQRPDTPEKPTLTRARAAASPPPKEKAATTPHTHIESTAHRTFPLSTFKHSFALFSKSFSSFPHGTCSLSVSRSVFSFRCSVPPTWSCSPKQLDSKHARRAWIITAGWTCSDRGNTRGSHPLRRRLPTRDLHPGRH